MASKLSECVDLLATTLPDLPKQYFEVMWDNIDYEFSRIYQQDRMVIDGGTTIQRKVMLDNSGNARYRRLFDTDSPAIGDQMKTITVPWTLLGTNYSWEVFEILNQKNSAKGFIRLIEERRIDGLWSLATLIEQRGWMAPDSATDDLHPYGIPYYLNCMDADTTTDGFVGQTVRFGNGTTSHVVASLDALAESKWRNYAALYSKVDNAMLKTFRKAFISVGLKAPLNINDPSQPRNAAKRIYTDIDTTVELQDLIESRQDNHAGNDAMGSIFADAGTVYINRLPVVPIQELVGVTDTVTGDAYAPIYCVDLSYLIPVVHDGYWMEEGAPEKGGTAQHTVVTVFLDGAHNNLCTNRRKAGFVLHKAITA